MGQLRLDRTKGLVLGSMKPLVSRPPWWVTLGPPLEIGFIPARCRKILLVITITAVRIPVVNP